MVARAVVPVLLGVAALPCASSLLPSTSGGPIGHMRAPAPRAPLSALRLNAADDNVFEGRIAQFAPRQQLPQVRGQLSKLQSQLADAIADEDYVHAAMLRDDLAELRNKDPAVMAATLREELGRHVERERYAEAAKCRDELLVIRRFLPQYQLAGLWKGNYPNHGDETVRLHYDGDQLCGVPPPPHRQGSVVRRSPRHRPHAPAVHAPSHLRPTLFPPSPLLRPLPPPPLPHTPTWPLRRARPLPHRHRWVERLLPWAVA